MQIDTISAVDIIPFYRTKKNYCLLLGESFSFNIPIPVHVTVDKEAAQRQLHAS